MTREEENGVEFSSDVIFCNNFSELLALLLLVALALYLAVPAIALQVARLVADAPALAERANERRRASRQSLDQ